MARKAPQKPLAIDNIFNSIRAIFPLGISSISKIEYELNRTITYLTGVRDIQSKVVIKKREFQLVFLRIGTLVIKEEK